MHTIKLHLYDVTIITPPLLCKVIVPIKSHALPYTYVYNVQDHLHLHKMAWLQLATV